MRPRTELAVAAGVAVLLVVVAGATGRRMRGSDDPDPRASTFLAGRAGTQGLYDAVERLGMVAERWRERPRNLASKVWPPGTSFVVIDPSRSLSLAERTEIRSLAASDSGADLVLAGVGAEGLMRCFGYLVMPSVFDSSRVAMPGETPARDAAFVHAWLVPVRDSARNDTRPFALSGGAPCATLSAAVVDTLLTTPSGKLVMLRLRLSGADRQVLLIGDAALLRNRGLRESSTGPVVLDAVRGRSRRFVFDEYHHGYGPGGSMLSVTLAWSRRHPMGWLVWQLAIVGLLALVAGGVRFGPVRAAFTRQRRSPLEHVRALATALAAARGHRQAVAAIVRGLRRRLSPGTAHPRTKWRPWLDDLVRRAPNAQVREQAERLARIADSANPDTAVLAAANAVEDVWQSLRP